jgi:hypothetical protein
MPRYVGEIITASAITLIAGYIFWYSASLPAGGGLFPQFAATCTVLLSLYWIATACLRRRDPDRSEAVDFTPTYEKLKPLIVIAASIAYVVLIFVVGFFVATTLFVVAVCAVLGVRNWRMVGLTLVILMPLVYLFFVSFLGARLPTGFAI